ncbi:metallophosphoesterase [Deinococcus rubellus]|nr:metallophosphoesterase [Deinococcus rubellus]
MTSFVQPSTHLQTQPRPLGSLSAGQITKRIMLVADMVHPYVYRNGFPQGLPELDLVLSAGDIPGYFLEFLATTLTVPVVYVPGNHNDEYINEGSGRHLPQGVINADGRVISAAGLRIAGWGGVPRYRDGENQYTAAQARWGLGKLAWQARGGVDIFLTHAPPTGPHAGSDYAHRGCEFISGFIEKRRPKLVVHGHIHEYEGKKVSYTDEASGAQVINAYGYHILELAQQDERLLAKVGAGD